MDDPEEHDKQNKVTKLISSSNECELDQNIEMEVQKTSILETQTSNTVAISSNECKIDRNLDIEVQESSVSDTHISNTVAISSNECKIDRNPDTEIQEISVSQTNTSSTQPGKVNINNEYRHESDSWSDDDEDSSSSSDTSSDSDFFQILIESSAPKKLPNVKTKGELGLEDLPPIEDLVISVQEDETILIGKIHAIVDKLVVIHALKDMKPLDLDSVLFLSHDKPLGRVFDIFGPVVEPFYCVRFNSTDDINDKGVEIGSDVFFAPEKDDITTYVFIDELQRQKGSDASWKHNNEPPEEFLDFSDDEEEKAAKRKRVNRNRNRQFSNNSDVASKKPSLSGDSSHSNYKNYSHSAPPRNNVFQYNQFPRHNPFSTPPLPPLSPSPSICSVMSTPVRVRNSFNRFSTPNQPRLRLSDPQRPFQQNMLQRSPSLLFATYPPPPVFGQMALLSPMPSPSVFHTPVTNNISTLIPGSQAMPSPSLFNTPVANNMPTFISRSQAMTPQNYFSQRFVRSPSPLHQVAENPRIFLDHGFRRNSPPVSQSQRTMPDPWLPNMSPDTFRVPPNHPLTVQIPNQNTPSLNTFQPNSLQPFVNNNINLYNGNVQTRFY